MKRYSLASENNGKVFHVNAVCGLIQCTSEAHEFVGGIPVGFESLSGDHGKKYLPLNEVFKLSKIIGSKLVEIGYLKCEKLLLDRNDEQIYLTSLLQVDVQKLNILECLIEGAQISFRDLEQSYAPSWLSACCTFNFTYGHVENFSNEVSLDVASLRSKEEFYCHLGEIFFGYGGYAGKDLDGCCEILKPRCTSGKIVITVKDEEEVATFLADATGYALYYDRFKMMIGDLGGEIIPLL